MAMPINQIFSVKNASVTIQSICGFFLRKIRMAYDEAIVANHLPWKKLNFPDGMPIEDQSDDDDGFWA